ncbi:MAG: ATPase, T2SS/T4P/T4SS family [Rhodanobacter sp.]|jgi:type II secretory ATPase GspE/PulE/Tfp pilus assembly ATPase PilB-like protein
MVVENAGPSLLPPSDSMAAQIAFDEATLTVYVSQQFSKDPMLMTWVSRNERRGTRLTVKVVELADVARFRDQGFRFVEAAAGDEKDNNDEYQFRGDALKLIEEAAYYRASDIHFLLRGEHADVQLTVNNDLRHFREMKQEYASRMLRAIWNGLVTTGDNQWTDNIDQGAQVSGEKLHPSAGVTSIRIARGPMFPMAEGGQYMVLRLQYANTVGAKRREGLPALKYPRKPQGEFLLPKMGFTKQNCAKLKKIMTMPDGILIITGPTGSGKSTTDYELRKEEARIRPYLKQIVVADPIEFPESWSTQLPVVNAVDQTATGEQFAKKLHTSLRMAPKIITPGEIRGAEVALIAFEASTTGHKVTTTLHVSDAFLWPDRLELMDQVRLRRAVFCDPKIVRGVVAQRLLSELCPDCSRLASAHPELVDEELLATLRTWSHDGDVSRVRIRGDDMNCPTCRGDGKISRFGIMEVVVTDAQLMSDYIHLGTAMARRNYHQRPDADPPLLDTAIQHVLAGRVDPYHVQEAVDIIVTKERFHEVIVSQSPTDGTSGGRGTRHLEAVANG